MDSRVRSTVVTGVFVLATCAPTGVDAPTTTQGATTSTTTATTTTEPVLSEACSGEPRTPLDSAALAAQSIVADVDEDGFDDAVTGYLLGASDPTYATAAVIHLELASGWARRCGSMSCHLPRVSQWPSGGRDYGR